MKTNTTGLLKISVDSVHGKFKAAEKGYEFGWMDCARMHRIVKAKTREQIRHLFYETMENKNNSFDSLFSILEYIMTNTDPKLAEYHYKALKVVFGGSINGYKVLDHIMDRMYKHV